MARQQTSFARLCLALCLLLLVAVVGMQTRPLAAQSNPTPAPVRGWFDVGGYALYLDCEGEGTPAVVFDGAVGNSSRGWIQVPRQVAAFTRACVYDRAGIGNSDRSPVSPHTSRVMAEELHTLLINAGIAAPYVLVGHAFGGLNVRVFADAYPDEVAGMVLVDAMPEDLLLRLADIFPPEQIDEVERYYLSSPELTMREFRQSLDEARATRDGDDPPLGDRPLVVLSAGIFETYQLAFLDDKDAMAAVWAELQTDLMTLSTHSTQIIAEKSGHFIQNSEPELIVAAVQQVVSGVRASSVSFATPLPRPTAAPGATEAVVTPTPQG